MLRDKVLSEVSIQNSHPIIYDSYNICELVLNSKLSSFLVSMLRSICEAFGLETSEKFRFICGKGSRVNYFFNLGSHFCREPGGNFSGLSHCLNYLQS